MDDAFIDSDYAILLNSIPRGEAKVRTDLMVKNAILFKEIGNCIN
jgi:malate/lactate dehydrogenase